jgi:hypothetical protein
VAISAALHVTNFRAPDEGLCVDSHLPQSSPHGDHLLVDLSRSAAASQRVLRSSSHAAGHLALK